MLKFSPQARDLDGSSFAVLGELAKGSASWVKAEAFENIDLHRVPKVRKSPHS